MSKREGERKKKKYVLWGRLLSMSKSLDQLVGVKSIYVAVKLEKALSGSDT